MLILNNDEIESLISVETSLRFLESAYSQKAGGKAVYRPRTDLYLSKIASSGVYAFKSMEGGLADPPVVALRLNSDVIRWEEQEGRTIKRKIPQAGGGKWVGLILLFSAETGEPLAIFPDGVIQRWCVAGTSALAARYLARQEATTLGLFGSGWQAGAHVPMRRLKDLVSGTVPGRKSEKEITCFINNIGMGLQFAALGAAVYADAKSKGMGREVPTDWFLESVHP